MTCRRGESLVAPSVRSFPFLPICDLLFQQDTLSIFSILPSTLFVSSHLRSKEPPELPHKSTHRLADWCICVCMCIVAYILCILDYKSKYLCQIAGGILCVYWQITVGSAATCLLDTLSKRQKIGLNICLLLCCFCCLNADPAALIASDSDNKNRLPEKTFWRPPPASAQKSQKNEPNQTSTCFSLWMSLRTFWNLEVIVLKLRYHHTSDTVVGSCL